MSSLKPRYPYPFSSTCSWVTDQFNESKNIFLIQTPSSHFTTLVMPSLFILLLNPGVSESSWPLHCPHILRMGQCRHLSSPTRAHFGDVGGTWSPRRKPTDVGEPPNSTQAVALGLSRNNFFFFSMLQHRGYWMKWVLQGPAVITQEESEEESVQLTPVLLQPVVSFCNLSNEGTTSEYLRWKKSSYLTSCTQFLLQNFYWIY